MTLPALLEALASLAEHVPEKMRAKHLAAEARRWAKRVRDQSHNSQPFDLDSST